MAGNTITAVIPKILAQGLMALRQNAITPRIVNSMTTTLAGQKGSTIDVPIASAITAVDVTPAATAPDAQAQVPTTIPVTVDQWKEAPFDLSDNEIEQAMDGVIPMVASQAIKSIVNAVDQHILSKYVDIWGHFGTAGTTPFGTPLSQSPGVKDATGIRKILNKQLAPLEDRHVILDPDADAAALGLPEFANMNFSGSVEAMREGMLNRKLGFDWWMNQNIPTQIRNALGAGALTINGVNTAGVSTISIAKGAGANWLAKKGDLIDITHAAPAGVQQYVITADTTITQGANTNVPISPPLRQTTAGAEVVTSIDTHVVNLAIQRDCIAFANRPLVPPPLGLGVISLSQVDPISGLALRIEVVRQHKRTRWSFDFLWGAKVVRPELGARLLG